MRVCTLALLLIRSHPPFTYSVQCSVRTFLLLDIPHVRSIKSFLFLAGYDEWSATFPVLINTEMILKLYPLFDSLSHWFHMLSHFCMPGMNLIGLWCLIFLYIDEFVLPVLLLRVLASISEDCWSALFLSPKTLVLFSIWVILAS